MFKLATPWHPCDDRYFEQELRREVCADHALFGIDAKIIARRQDRDDFLFELPGGRYAMVHLTWGREWNPLWPVRQFSVPSNKCRKKCSRKLMNGITLACKFRRCVACGALTLVKDGWFRCGECDQELPADYNVQQTREA